MAQSVGLSDGAALSACAGPAALALSSLFGTRFGSLKRPELTLHLEIRRIQPMQLHEMLRQIERLGFRFHFHNRESANDLLTLGKRTVDDVELAVAQLNLLRVVGGLE